MDSVLNKLKQAQKNPEDGKKMDAIVRERKSSVSARQMVEEVNALHATSTPPAEIEVSLNHWKEQYPKLFSMILDPGYSRVMLYAMLDQLEAVEKGKKSTHDASVNVGTTLVNSYVRPKLGMAPVPLPN